MKTAWLLAFASIAVGASAAEPDQRRLKGFVGGWNGPGWWEFQITTQGVVDVVTTEHITKSLQEEQQLELGRLLAALPVANREYGCDAPLPVDTAAYYFLEISRPLESSRPDRVQRLNYCPDGVPGDPSPEVRALVALWRFVRGLFEDAHAPRPAQSLFGPERLRGPEGELPNKGMNLTRVGAGAERSRRDVALSKVAVQVMPGVRQTVRRTGGAA